MPIGEASTPAAGPELVIDLVPIVENGQTVYVARATLPARIQLTWNATAPATHDHAPV